MENLIEKYGGVIVTIPVIAAVITMFSLILVKITI